VTYINKGKPFPLGSSLTSQGVNFSLVATNAEYVEILLFEKEDSISPKSTFKLDQTHNTGPYWHAEIKNLDEGCIYAFRVKQKNNEINNNYEKKVLLDPCSRGITGWRSYKRENALKNQENFGNIKRFLCKVRKSINFKDQSIYVGDEVVIDNIDLKSKRASITSLKKRKNLLTRPSVANISNIYIIFSVEEPEINFSQVNRFLISAESMGVEVSLVLTKCDLISDKKRSYLLDKFEKWGYQVITLNLQKSDCFNNLLAEVKQKECSIFMGPSGVGKTTLLNMIIPGLQNSTAPVSSKIKRGKNTTRNVELFSISNQSYIVDTPGFNMQPLEVDIKLLPNLYSEIYKQVIEEGIKCKFRNCLHLNDEGCNLNKSFERYSFYKEMIESSKSHYYQNQED